MMSTVYNLRRTAAFLVVFVVCLSSSSAAFADDLLVVVAERVVSAEGDEATAFWWGDSRPVWSGTDVALREALRQEGSGFAEPESLNQLSRIYRVPELTDSSAAAMASVFGRRRVLVGTIEYGPTALTPVGLHGWRTRVDVRLVERGSDGPVVRQAIEFQRSRWGASGDVALATLRNEIAEQIARTVSGGLQKKVGPVGVDSEELLIALRSVEARATLGEVVARLETFAGVERVAPTWAAEGRIVLEVNPGELDAETSVRQYASLLQKEQFEDFRLIAGESDDPSVVVFRVEESVR